MAARESLAVSPEPQKTLRERADEARRAGGVAGAPTADAGALLCDQAVFTSVRTPMGEGYRIIAASAGLKPDERQAITKNAPSHDALCDAGEDATGVAFYLLPTGRLCIAHSCCAGAEHTGRGGQRIYTVSVVFDAAQFAKTGFNPFRVLRAMSASGMTRPQLKQPGDAPQVALQLEAAADTATSPALHVIGQAPFDVESRLAGPLRRYVIHELLGESRLCVCVPGDYHATAEAVLMAIPGPLRAKLTFASGLKFSVARSYRLSVVAEDSGATEARICGQPIRYLKRSAPPPQPAPENEWMKLVEAFLSAGRATELALRTSRPFHDCTPHGRQRTAKLFLTFDEVATADAARLLAVAGEYLGAKATGCEKDLLDDLLSRTRCRLGECLGNAGMLCAPAHWSSAAELWNRSPEAAVFMQDVIAGLLRTAAAKAPSEAANMALGVARNVPAGVNAAGHGGLLEQVLESFAAWALSIDDEPRREANRATARKWNAILPGHPAVARVLEQPVGQPKPPPPAR